jgi:Inositol 1,4,5-trisphosphate/ryanodine receptor
MMEEVTNRQGVLRYGQIIRIHGNYFEHDPRRGLLCAKGFTDCNVYYLTY